MNKVNAPECTCIGFNPQLAMRASLGEKIIICKKTLETKRELSGAVLWAWYCIREKGHDGECVACNHTFADGSGLTTTLHWDWHGVSRANPWGTFCSYDVNMDRDEGRGPSPPFDATGERYEDHS